jgi:hypothetical protein
VAQQWEPLLALLVERLVRLLAESSALLLVVFSVAHRPIKKKKHCVSREGLLDNKGAGKRISEPSKEALKGDH